MNTRYGDVALVERPVACAGKGRYFAVVHHGSPGGELHVKVFEYSRKDPRYKGEAAVLRDITLETASRYRGYIVAISVIKHCLHPKSAQVPKANRQPHVERVYSWVVEHDNTVKQAARAARRMHLDNILEGHKVLPVQLPYTSFELQMIPAKHIATTNYWPNAHAAIELRGVERRVGLHHLVLASLANV
jgi:hypothetical protein